jgi:isoleucyl-tRNA synthetase
LYLQPYFFTNCANPPRYLSHVALQVGARYEPLFAYFAAHHPGDAFKVVSDGYVTDDSGTGVVHQAPAFGEDDYRWVGVDKVAGCVRH